MKIAVWVLVVAVVCYIGYEFVRMSRLVRVSAGLVEATYPYMKNEGAKTLLVLGDSTAVGVGAPANLTVAARLSGALDASTENYSKSGAVTADLLAQIAHAKRARYDAILIHIGANDIIRFHNVGKTREELDASIKEISQKSDHIILLTAGKVGRAPFFPKLFGWLWTRQSAALRSQFIVVAEKYNIAYVDLYNGPDPFSEDPQKYYAPDGLHLTGDGYGEWYKQVAAAMESKWPGFLHG